MTNCRYISRHKLQCLPVPAKAEKIKNRIGLDDLDCNSMVPSKREATMTLAVGLQKGSTFVDSTFGIDNTNIMSVGAKHLDISINSCKVKTGTSIEVESGCIEVDGGVDGSSSAVPCSAIVGGTNGSVATDIVGVSGTESLGTLEIGIEDGSG